MIKDLEKQDKDLELVWLCFPRILCYCLLLQSRQPHKPYSQRRQKYGVKTQDWCLYERANRVESRERERRVNEQTCADWVFAEKKWRESILTGDDSGHLLQSPHDGECEELVAAQHRAAEARDHRHQVQTQPHHGQRPHHVVPVCQVSTGQAQSAPQSLLCSLAHTHIHVYLTRTNSHTHARNHLLEHSRRHSRLPNTHVLHFSTRGHI